MATTTEYAATFRDEDIGSMLNTLSEFCATLDEHIAEFQSILDELQDLAV